MRRAASAWSRCLIRWSICKRVDASQTAAFCPAACCPIKPVVCHQDGVVAVLGKARGSKKGNNLLIQQVKEAGGIDS